MKTFVFNSFILVALVCLVSCSSEDQISSSKNDHGFIPNQKLLPRFSDAEFDPYTSNCLSENANMDFIDNVVDGLSFFSDYFDGDTSNLIDGYSTEQMALYLVNLYLSSQSASPLGSLPNYISNIHYSSAVLNKLHEIRDYALDTSRLSVAYSDFQYKCCNVSLSGLTRSQIDTISTISYAMDITLNWALNDPVFDVFDKFDGSKDHSSSRIWNYPPGYHMTGADWRCCFGIWGGAYVGATEGGLLGALIGGMFGASQMGCNW